MKLPLACRVFLCLTIIAIVVSLSDAQSTATSSCRKRVKENCTSKRQACARIGRANICWKFSTDCERRLANCGRLSNQRYHRMTAGFCVGMPLNQKRPCGSGNSTSNANTPVIYA